MLSLFLNIKTMLTHTQIQITPAFKSFKYIQIINRHTDSEYNKLNYSQKLARARN